MPPLLTKYEDDIGQRTRWWSSYPTTGFNERARAGDALQSFVTDAFVAPRCLAKSASATSLSFTRHAGDRTFQPLRRTSSYSALSPSHALPYDCRVAQRSISAFRSVTPNYDRWYLGAYAPSHYRDTHTYAYDQFYKWRDEPAPTLVRNWYHTGLEHRSVLPSWSTSYLRGSKRRFNEYVKDRARYDADLLNYVYDSYDRRPDTRYTRYMTGEPQSFVNMSLRLPEFQPSWHRYRLYKFNRRVVI